MKKVRMLTCSAGPKGTVLPGETVDVDEVEAKLLVDGGFAVFCEDGALPECGAPPWTEEEPDPTPPEPAPKGRRRAKG